MMVKFKISMFCAMFIFMNCVFANEKADNETNIKFDVNLSTGVLVFNNIDIVSLMQFSFSDSNWLAMHAINLAKAKKEMKDGQYQVSITNTIDNIGRYSLKMKWSDLHFEYDYEYEVCENNKVTYIVADVFLSKDIFKRPPTVSPSKVNVLIDPVEKMDFVTPLGKFKFSMSAVNNKSNWLLRDESKTDWRPSRYQALSFLNSYIRKDEKAVKQKLHFAVEFEPFENAGLSAKKIGALNLIEKLKRNSELLESDLTLNELSKMELALRNQSNEIKETAFNQISKRLIEISTAVSQKQKTYSYNATIIPCPQEIEYLKTSYIVNNDSLIVISDGATNQEIFAANILQNELRDYFGVAVPIVKGDKYSKDKKPIIIGCKNEKSFINDIYEKVKKNTNLTLHNKREAYVLNASQMDILIYGNDYTGAFYGVQSLIQLLHKDCNGQISLPCVKICDWPDMSFRGMMFDFKGPEKRVECLKKAISRISARHKFNTLVLVESDGGSIKWKSHPEVATSPNAITIEKLSEIIEYSKAHCMDVIPQVQSLGHVESTLKVHPELADSPDPKNPGDSFCMSNPLVRKYLSDIYDETIALYKPKYFHIGLDEATSVGQNPLCKGAAPDELLSQHVKWCNDYLKSKGVSRVIIFHDLLLDRKAWGDFTPANSNFDTVNKQNNMTHPAVKSLPKDVIIDFWSYRGTGDFPAIPYFQKFGYDVLCSSWFQEKNNYDLSAAAKKYNTMGIIATTWGSSGGSVTAMDSLLSIENAWSTGKLNFDKINYNPQEKLNTAMLPPLPSGWVNTEIRPVNISAYCNQTLNGDAVDFDFRTLATGAQVFGNINFYIVPSSENDAKQCIAVAGNRIGKKLNLPSSVNGIAINKKVKSIIFLHTSIGKNLWAQIGKYVISYTDGTQSDAPIENLDNIFPSRKDSEMVNANEYFERIFMSSYLPNAKKVWTGFNLTGEIIDLQAYEWVNPQPEKEIRNITLSSLSQYKDNMILLLGISTVE